MKKKKIDPEQQLALAKETLIALSEEQLTGVIGGQSPAEDQREEESCIAFYCD